MGSVSAGVDVKYPSVLWSPQPAASSQELILLVVTEAAADCVVKNPVRTGGVK